MDQTDKMIFIALPCLDELETLPAFLECMRRQTFKNYKLIVCVNQPDEWWGKVDKMEICFRNKKTIDHLTGINDIPIEIIDRSTKGNGWKGKKNGVGWARKTLMDHIALDAEDEDIIISLDADTSFGTNYFQSIIENFYKNPNPVALSTPYYHQLTGNEEKDRAILHYEIYMRYYALNLWRIGNPYNFTAIGSAIALPVKIYKKIGGLTPHKSGEDFYFLQKLRKFGEILTWNEEKVYPAARYSDRVGFGTGPAMIKGSAGNWMSYPIYPYSLFDEVHNTYDTFSLLFDQDADTPMDEFNDQKFSEPNIWKPLRANFKTKEKFVRACTHKIDAFRILQFLKWRNNREKSTDEENLISWFSKFYKELADDFTFDLKELSFLKSSIEELDQIRNVLVIIEENYQRTGIESKI